MENGDRSLGHRTWPINGASAQCIAASRSNQVWRMFSARRHKRHIGCWRNLSGVRCGASMLIGDDLLRIGRVE